ncbi:unnamed protein product [Prorocentrum cordatum]|uniref:Solute carrier family 40 protein n=1 Tax=Prorocentrum cordatum TaxID=2364126 RepID=A0ABN9XLR3_9DINO|nr:unnamed protein product [Polarella glacialis]
MSLALVVFAQGGFPVEAVRLQIRTASVVISATWAGAIASVAQLFLCDSDFEDDESYLVALGYQEQCSMYNPTFRVLRVFGVAIGILWTIVLPALIQMTLRRWRDRVRPAVHEITSAVQFFVEDENTLTCQCTVVDLCKRAGAAALEDAVGASCGVYTAWLRAYSTNHGDSAASLQRASGGRDWAILRLSLSGPTASQLADDLADAAAADAERLQALQASLRVRLLLLRWQREGREPVLCGLGFFQKYDPAFVSFELMLKIMTTAFGYVAAVTGTLNKAVVGMGTCATALMLLVNLSPHIDRSNDRLLAACFSSLLVACSFLALCALNMVDRTVLSQVLRPTLAVPVALLAWDVAMMLLPEQRKKSLIFLFELESKRLEYLHTTDGSDGKPLATEADTAELVVASGKGP